MTRSLCRTQRLGVIEKGPTVPLIVPAPVERLAQGRGMDTGSERRLPAAAVDLALERGDLLRVLTPGGGGNGEAGVACGSASAARLRPYTCG
jgi:hypothetical protein